MGKKIKCCEGESKFKSYKKCVSITFTEGSGSGLTFVMTFYFSAIKKVSATMMWLGYSSLTLSNFTSATTLSFTGNYSICGCTCFNPKGDNTKFKAPILYNLSTLTPTTLTQVGEIGFNSSGNITITLTQPTDFANTNVITFLGGATTYNI